MICALVCRQWWDKDLQLHKQPYYSFQTGFNSLRKIFLAIVFRTIFTNQLKYLEDNRTNIKEQTNQPETTVLTKHLKGSHLENCL